MDVMNIMLNLFKVNNKHTWATPFDVVFVFFFDNSECSQYHYPVFLVRNFTRCLTGGKGGKNSKLNPFQYNVPSLSPF